MKLSSLRFRLTVLITGFFVTALVVAGLIARDRLAQTLTETAPANATSALTDSLAPQTASSISGDSATVTTSGITRLVFFDNSGDEVSQEEFVDLMGQATAMQLAELGFFFDAGPFGPVLGAVPLYQGPLVGTAQSFEITPAVILVGEVASTETQDEIVVSQPVLLGGTQLVAAVTTPRQPLNDSLAAFTRLGLVLIPLIGALLAGATWLTTSRVLRPVEAIRRQVELTDPKHLDHHVPRSGSGDEIDRLAGTMNEMLDRLHSASHKQRQFVSDASHELRSPITATLATLENSDERAIAEHWPEVAATLGQQQNRLARLVDDLLLLAIFDETSADSSSRGEVDLDELVLAEAGRPHAISVEAVVESPHRIKGSRRMLERCIGNLVENATRHGKCLVRVTVGTSTSGTATVTVDDDGPGIPAEKVETVFERFTRLDDARNRRDGGAGLGLSIARDIAQQHGASLSASKSRLGGASFELAF
jgi:signal transduction histidine kinase